jgi:predicted ATPase/DNA-binding CsgD family transcriptional regulator
MTEANGSGVGTLTTQPNNLPVQLTSFVGRDAEISDVLGLVAGARMVSVTGAAGCGKTRLALHAANVVLPDFRDGVWLIELSRVNDAAFVGEAVATVLGVRDEPGGSISDSLAAHLNGRRTLLVLDGCEHVVEAAASLADDLLRRCSELRLLVTSREALRVAGEAIWRIPSLAPSDAAALFLDRAHLADSNFHLEVDQAAMADLVCRRLDGIPLAIELAAARVHMMSVQQILERLEDRFRLLTGGSRTALPRHQTLRAAVDWSYQQLDESEALLFRRLSVFSGDFAVDSLEAVCCDDRVPADEVIDLLTRLTDKSLVVPEAGAGDRFRYRLLETLSEYGRERLVESGEADALRRRHADHFVQLAETAGEGRIAEEQSNFSRGLEFLRASGDAAGLRLAIALVGYWDSAGRLSEGRERLEALLRSATGELDVRGRALDGAGWLAFRQADMAGARAHFMDARNLLQRLGDSAELARTLSNLAMACIFSGELEKAREHLEESLQVGRRAGSKKSVAGALWVLGLVAYFAGDLDEAEERARASLQLSEEVGDRKLAAFLEAALGVVALERGRFAEAQGRLQIGLEMSVEMGDRMNTALILEALCRLASATSAWTLALKLGGAGAAIRELAGARSVPIWQERVEEAIEEARRMLGPEAAGIALGQGRSLDFTEAVGLARKMATRATQQEVAPMGLTKRELEIAVMVAQGMSNRDMAKRLVLAQRTVEGHVENIRSKLGFHSRTQIAAWAVERKLVAKP